MGFAPYRIMRMTWLQQHKHWLAGATLAVAGLWLSGVWLQEQQQANARTAELRFTEEVRSSSDAIAQRITAFTEVTQGLRDLFLVKPQLDYAEFQRVVTARQVRYSYPAIRNLSFSRWVLPADLPAFKARMQQQAEHSGWPMPVLPEADGRPDYYLLEYLWPPQGNEGVWGLDLARQPNNLAAMLASRASGQPVVSAPFQLLQESTQRTAFMLRVPVFQDRAGQAPQFLGAVAASVDVQRMLETLAGMGFFRGVAVQLEDAGSGVQGAQQPLQRLGLSDDFARAQQLRYLPPQVRVLQVHDRRWRLSFYPSRALLSDAEYLLPWWRSAGLALLSLLLGAWVAWLLRRHNQALRHSEARFAAVFNQAAVGMALAAVPTGRLVRANQCYGDILGYTEQELLERDFQSLTDPQDLAHDLALSAQLQAGSITDYHLEKRMRHKSGAIIWVDLTVSPMWLPGSEPDYQLGVIQDITERRQLQDALHQREQHLRNILDHLPVGVCLLQQGQRMAYSNRRFLEITGYSLQQVPDLATWWQAAYPDELLRSRVRQHWLELCEQAEQQAGRIALGEYEVCCADGRRRVLNISGVIVEGDHLVFFEDLSQRKAAEAELHYLAAFDPLTRLPNRRQLLDYLRQALVQAARGQRGGAVLLLDMDHFKTINETQGHEVGDLLLWQVGQRLQAALTGEHLLARYGDDEFVVVLADLADQAAAAQAKAQIWAQQALESLRVPHVLNGKPCHCTASIGLCVFYGAGNSVDELLRRADLAMNQAKSIGRDTVQCYTPDMQTQVHARAALEADMRQGLQQGQFSLYYQPQVTADQVTGCEALLRWQHPEKGFISPMQFIALAEETGLILPLGQWVLRNACMQLASWARQPEMAHLSLAINVSPRQFHQPNFVDHVLEALAHSGADARRLELELTEGLLLQDVQDTVDKMLALKRHGVAFSLDDFGTGYSSLSYLKRLPLDQLKIDQSFVRDVLTDANDAAIARTIVALGTSLNLRVIAEGVETQAQCDFLQQQGCHIWQGYLFSRPVPPTQLQDWIRQRALGNG